MKSPRIRSAVAVAAATGAGIAAPAAWAQPVPPHLVPLLPATASAGQRAPVFVDALQRPGHLLYRFDSVIHNEGGALDMIALRPRARSASTP